MIDFCATLLIFLLSIINVHNPIKNGMIAARVADKAKFTNNQIIVNIMVLVLYLVRKKEHRKSVAQASP